MKSEIEKRISVKHIGSKRPMDDCSITPGSSVNDLLKSLGYALTGFHLTDPNDPEAIFNGNDNLYSRVNDGDLLAIVAAVDAGYEAA